MKDRLKNTILSTLVLSKGRIKALIIIEVILTVVMGILQWTGRIEQLGWQVFFGNDLPIIFFLFTYGLFFYESHTAFCISNAVSRKYQLISQLLVSGGICFMAAVFDSVMREIIVSVSDFSIAQVIRIAVTGGFFRDTNIIATILETFAMYLMEFYVGFGISAIKETKGAKVTLIVMFLMAWVLVAGIAIGYFTWINPIAWIFGLIPAFMMGSAFLATLFYLLIAVGSVLLAYKLTGSSKNRAEEV